MKRFLALGLVVFAQSLALGQQPVSVYPSIDVPATSPYSPMPTSMGTGSSTVNAPLPMLVQQYAPITPSGYYPGSCESENCSSGSCSSSTRRGNCLQRLFTFLTLQPGEPVVPFLNRANPYRAPLIAYFPCKEQLGPISGNSCASCSQCASGPALPQIVPTLSQRMPKATLRDRLAFNLGYMPSPETVSFTSKPSPFRMIEPVQYQSPESVPFSKR